MRTFEFDSLDKAYYHLIKAIYEDGSEVSPRGMLTKELSPVTVTITNPRNRVISHPLRKLNYGFMIGEAMWYLSGTNDLDQVAHYNSQWNKFTDDGKTLNGAYGHRIFNYKDIVATDTGEIETKTINQFEAMIEKFKKDKDSRHGTILIFRPTDLVKETKDVPCNNMLRFSIRNNKLNLMNIVRSNDIVFGTPYDMHFFMLLQEIAASRLGVELGNYVHVVDSFHMYEMHFEMAKQIIKYGETNIYETVQPQKYGIPMKDVYDSTLESILSIEKHTRTGLFDMDVIEDHLVNITNKGWKNYAYILIAYNFKKYKRIEECNYYLNKVTNEFKDLLGSK